MAVETRARNLVITDARDAFALRRYIREEERGIARSAQALWKQQGSLVTIDTVKVALDSGSLPAEWKDPWTLMIREFVRDDITPDWIKAISTSGSRIAKKVNLLQRKQMDFDSTMTAVKSWVDSSGGTLIKDLTAAQMSSVAALLQDQIALGVTSPYVLAQRIRPMIGLTNREAVALARFIGSLTEEGVPAGLINKQSAKYCKNLHKNRAMRIARTELSNSYNFGQFSSIHQAVDEGWLPGIPEKNWIAGGGNPCEDCTDNEAQGNIPLDTQFSSDHDHPTCHPQCECAVGYSIRR